MNMWSMDFDHDVAGHIAWLDDVDWLAIESGWHLIWTTTYSAGVQRLHLPRNWCLIGLG